MVTVEMPPTICDMGSCDFVSASDSKRRREGGDRPARHGARESAVGDRLVGVCDERGGQRRSPEPANRRRRGEIRDRFEPGANPSSL
jgi:hypothetical protein